MRRCYIILLSAMLCQCARIGQPSGGPKDIDAPQLLQSIPENGQKNFNGKNIELVFDEYIKLKDAKEEIVISPSPGEKTKFIVKKNKLIITPENDWKENTTYNIAFRDGIQDLNESNPADNLHLAFSTGPTIDSLQISGYVTEAFKEKNPEKITVALYESDTFNIFNHKPVYFTKTSKSGNFTIQNLKSGTYYIYAFDDKSKNLKIESKTERFGFLVNSIRLPGSADTLKIELVRVDARPLKLTAVRNSSTISTIRFNKPIDSLNLNSSIPIIYTFADTHSEVTVYKDFEKSDSLKINVWATDSLHQKIDTAVYVKFTENKKLDTKFKMSEWQTNLNPENNLLTAQAYSNKLLLSINYDSIYLQLDTTNFQSIEPKDISVDTLNKKINLSIKLKIDKKEGKLSPVLLFGKGAFISIDNDSTKSEDIKIKIPKEDNTGTVSIEINTKEKNYEVQLLTNDNKVVRSFRDLSKYIFKYITPAEYRINVIIDSNNNNRWDPGNFYKKTAPEKIILYRNSENKYTFPIRANWEVGPLVITF